MSRSKNLTNYHSPVSYTHLDVYKRQPGYVSMFINSISGKILADSEDSDEICYEVCLLYTSHTRHTNKVSGKILIVLPGHRLYSEHQLVYKTIVTADYVIIFGY